MRSRILAAAIAAAVLLPFAASVDGAPPVGDPVRGKAVYAMCMYCHSIDENRIGPKHRGLFGRTAGTVPGFSYSAAMKQAGRRGLVWSAKTLDLYLTDPQKVVPGTRMLFGGIADAGRRADLIAYLERATAQSKTDAARSP
jgi:cytochrome c